MSASNNGSRVLCTGSKFQLSALTHRDGTPWTEIYDHGRGKYDEIPPDLIRDHFVELAQNQADA